MKTLIIAEKSSLAGNVVQAIERNEKFDKKNGYYESENYIVSWAVGHLLQLKDIQDYEGEKKAWSQIKLPYIPEKFEFKLKETTKKQFYILKELIKREDVNCIFNCGDPDREGEVIIRLILNQVRNKKTVYRLWLPDQEENTVLSALREKKLDSEYDNLYAEGIARTIMDWILGINETIFLTNKSGELLRAGRILVPVVKKIYDRDMEIKNFIPEKYYQAESDIDGIKLIFSEKYNKKEDSELKCNELNNSKTIVEDITLNDIKKQPSKLFSLTSLQEHLNKKYKMSAKQVLSIVQKLYENKYLTYPRTDSNYMTEEEKDKVRKIIEVIEDPKIQFKDKKTVFDNSKVDAHSAITPTTTIPNLIELSEEEKCVYEAVFNRFKANFCIEDCIISETNIIIKNGENEFKLVGKTVKQKGFLEYENSDKEKTLPPFKKGDTIITDFKVVEKETKPPKKLSESDLILYLKHPFKKETDEDNEVNIKEIGLGTVATRASIIENAKSMKYITDNKNILSIGEAGIKLIETINKLNISLYADKTIEFSKDLKKVNTGELTLEQCIENVKNEIEQIVKNGQNIEIEKRVKDKVEKEIIGKCPRCGKNIYEASKSFYCEGFKDEKPCKFSLFKEDNFFKIRGKKISKSIAKKLLSEGKVKVTGFKKKDNTGTYDANVIMDLSNEKYVNFQLDFSK
ncbi:DNA topoisomerase [uncultured Clostridium sp.]|uniref:DNA topoisomerase n=1 Tax=uncultured Clostridium sp. TaxID=59620 RepID=UPI00258CC93B|nr:DNA topoisomerase [uncultured Clostridium sp.]